MDASDAWRKYVDDPRSICKYGTKCYQKNPQHLTTFKHPPPSKRKPAANNHHGSKRAKVQTTSPGSIRADVINCEEKPEEKKDDVYSPIPERSPERPNKAQELAPENTCPENQMSSQDLQPNKSKAEDFIFLESKTDVDRANTIKELFLVDMPKDFYSFWEFLSKENVNGADILASANLETIGPFDLLGGKLPHVDEREKYLLHWRFFYDPPEFQAIIKSKGRSEFHLGYYRDSPKDNPVFVGSNDSSKNCTITPLAENIFGALYIHLQAEKKSSPFTAMSIQKLTDKLKAWAEAHGMALDKFDTRRRLAATAVTRSFHGAGLVVPYNKSTQLGYRPLVESDSTIKKMLSDLSSAKSDEDRDKILSSLQPVITYANIAMDECDFGTGLELGINLFCSGLPGLNATILDTLTTAYSLLNRPEYSKIIQTHLENRRKGADMSILHL